jgi:hypothetical protein
MSPAFLKPFQADSIETFRADFNRSVARGSGGFLGRTLGWRRWFG